MTEAGVGEVIFENVSSYNLFICKLGSGRNSWDVRTRI